VEHVQPLQRSFPWRTTLVVAVVLACGALVAVEGGRFLDARHAGAATPRVQPSAPAEQPAGKVFTAPAGPLRPRSRVSVLVLNGNGTSGVAGATATRLLGRGYRSATATNAPSTAYATTLVLYRPGWQPEAERLAREVGARVVAPLDGRLPAGSGGDQLVVVLGR
jgi:hypothetical protein